MSTKNKSSTNVWNRLMYREYSGNLRRYKNQLFGGVPDRLKFVLEDIADKNKDIAKQVTLGWSKSGQYMISYDFAVELADSIVPAYGEELKPQVVYHLYLWKWQLFRPLQLECSISLFGGRQLPMNHIMGAKLAVVETENDKYFLVHGSPWMPPSVDDDSTVVNWLTVFVSPQHASTADLIHFEYQVQSPYPPFEGLTCFYQDMVLLNTGNAIHVCKLQHKPATPDTPQDTQDGIPSLWGKVSGESFSVTIEAPQEEFGVSSHDCFDAEGFIKRVKQASFKDSYVVDYDLRIVTPLPPQPQVLLMILIFFQRADGSLFGYPVYPVLNLLTGAVESISGKPFNCNANVTITQKKGYASGLVSQLRNVKSFPRNERAINKEWSNHTVFGGASVMQLVHPVEPVACVPQKRS
mmetsp:Transcript_1475/g.1947  ORF Transcript_1475/g.1947 Transcript_1475/m.1947 type:complete len:409 (-) Transcript_1475:1177-2403(-)